MDSSRSWSREDTLGDLACNQPGLSSRYNPHRWSSAPGHALSGFLQMQRARAIPREGQVFTAWQRAGSRASETGIQSPQAAHRAGLLFLREGIRAEGPRCDCLAKLQKAGRRGRGGRGSSTELLAGGSATFPSASNYSCTPRPSDRPPLARTQRHRRGSTRDFRPGGPKSPGTQVPAPVAEPRLPCFLCCGLSAQARPRNCVFLQGSARA